jgi:biotin transport system substrate-specific component
VMGLLADRGWDKTRSGVLVAMVVGEVLIFLPGVVWLAAVVGSEKAIALGLTPFLAAEAFKIILAVVTLPLIWRVVKR